jgi:hypothetical protein
LHYLSGAITFDPTVTKLDEKLASKIVWLDCLLTNVDRTARNTNMLIWHKELWLIDHGAALYFHHSWQNWEEHAQRPFLQVKDHVLLSRASQLTAVNEEFVSILTEERIRSIVSLIPAEWLDNFSEEGSAEDHRKVYADFLITRVAASGLFVKEAKMPENHLFEYAIIRIVPKVEREEFLNIGVVLYCKKLEFLETKYVLNEENYVSFVRIWILLN